MFLIRKLIFKFMELGLGLKTYFALETRNPVFINFALSLLEAEAVQKKLPPGFLLKKIRFSRDDSEPRYWLSYNLYEIKYPKKELAGVRRARCEINTFVESPEGKRGILVFSGSPFVSHRQGSGVVDWICEWAERLVIGIYGCGKLMDLTYELSDSEMSVKFTDPAQQMDFQHSFAESDETTALSGEYFAYNDISFFNEGKTFDLVNSNSAFHSAVWREIDTATLSGGTFATPFFERRPEKIYYHRGDITYTVNALMPRKVWA